MRALTELESLVLAHIWKGQPLTAYAVRNQLIHSPLGKFADSKGSIYPIIKRLTERGFVDGELVAQGERPSKQLVCSMEGEDALRAWIFNLDAKSLLSTDPLRVRVAFLEALRPRDKTKWIAQALDLLQEQRVLTKTQSAAPGEHDRFLLCAQDNVVLTLSMQIKWLGTVSDQLNIR